MPYTLWRQTCSLHTGEEGVLFIGDPLAWTVVIKLCLQSINAVVVLSATQDALPGLDQLFPC